MAIFQKTLEKTSVCFLCLLLCDSARGQETNVDSIHWAYSSYFGTGWYGVGERDVFVLRMTPRWELREPDFVSADERTIGIEFRFPITVGLDRFDLTDSAGIVDSQNLASLSVTPGIEITIPVTERWSLRPHATLGWGTLLDDSESAWIYWTGIKSRYTFQNEKLSWALINSVSYVGYTPNKGPSEDFWPLMAGLEFDYPIGQSRSDGEQLVLSWHGMYTSFENDLKTVIEDNVVEPITDQWEFGIALRKSKQPIKILWLNFDRLGLAYRFSSSGDFKGIAFVFRSVFER